MEVARRLSAPGWRAPRRDRDAALAGGAAQRVYGGSHGEAGLRPERRPRVSVHPAERAARPDARATRRRGAHDGVEQRPVRLPRAPVRGVAELRVLGSPTMTIRRISLAAGLVLAVVGCHDD